MSDLNEMASNLQNENLPRGEKPSTLIDMRRHLELDEPEFKMYRNKATGAVHAFKRLDVAQRDYFEEIEL